MEIGDNESFEKEPENVRADRDVEKKGEKSEQREEVC